MPYPPQRQSPRYLTLDAWRGLACLMVVVSHSTDYSVEAMKGTVPADATSWVVSQTPKLGAGVPIFFVISGYCISATADTNRRAGRGWWNYTKRRLRRIYPPYLILVGILAVVIALAYQFDPGLFRDHPHPMIRFGELTPWQMVGNLTLTEGWLGYIIRRPGQWWLQPAWTLGYEEQFYAVTGALLVLSRRWFFAGAAAVSLGVLVTQRVTPVGFFFDGLWLHFAMGVLVYHAAVYGDRRERIAAALIFVAVFAAAAYGAGYSSDNRREHDLVASASALLMLVLRPLDAASAAITKPLAWAGVITYSLYLVHRPICLVVSHLLWRAGFRSPTETLAVTVPLCVLASLAVAAPFWWGIERRFLNSKPPTLAASTPSVPVG